MSNVDILCMNVGVHACWRVVHACWRVVHACWHGLFNKCYRNVVHVKLGTDYP